MMDTQLVLAMLTFAFVTSVTPGPNNLMLLASGAQFGFRRTVPHMLGIAFGMLLLLGVTLSGLGVLFAQYPLVQWALRIVGVTYLLWLAWKIASAPVRDADESAPAAAQAQPLRWWQASAFQFVNPKAWMMALSAVSSFTLGGELYVWSGLALMAAFAAVNLPSISLWAGFGVVIRRFLSTPGRRRGFNGVMGALTAATVLMIVTV